MKIGFTLALLVIVSVVCVYGEKDNQSENTAESVSSWFITRSQDNLH